MGALRTGLPLASPHHRRFPANSSPRSTTTPHICSVPFDTDHIVRGRSNLYGLRTPSTVQSLQLLAVARSNSMAGTSHSRNDGKLSAVERAYSEIVVIRHGETEWNSNRRIQGHLDVDLNDVGRKQAAAVAERLSGETKVAAVYSSDLKRAHETAEIIASRCGGLEVIQDTDLRERHMGDLQGLVFHEAAKVCPEAHQALLSNKTYRNSWWWREF